MRANGSLAARELVERRRALVGGVVVGLEPALPHDDGIDRQRAHVGDEVRQVKGDLRVGWPVRRRRFADRAHLTAAVEVARLGTTFSLADGLGMLAAQPGLNGVSVLFLPELLECDDLFAPRVSERLAYQRSVR